MKRRANYLPLCKVQLLNSEAWKRLQFTSTTSRVTPSARGLALNRNATDTSTSRRRRRPPPSPPASSGTSTSRLFRAPTFCPLQTPNHYWPKLGRHTRAKRLAILKGSCPLFISSLSASLFHSPVHGGLDQDVGCVGKVSDALDGEGEEGVGGCVGEDE